MKFRILYGITISSTTTIEAENEQEAIKKFNRGEFDRLEENDEILDYTLAEVEEE